jgi:hypothetical protein
MASLPAHANGIRLLLVFPPRQMPPVAWIVGNNLFDKSKLVKQI